MEKKGQFIQTISQICKKENDGARNLGLMFDQEILIHETLLDIAETLKHIDYNLNLLREIRHGEAVKEETEQYDPADILKELNKATTDDGPPFLIPTLEELRQYAKRTDMKLSPEEFLKMAEARKWRCKDGKGEYWMSWETGYNALNGVFAKSERDRERKQMVVPSKKEVEEYFAKKGHPELAENFYEHYTKTGWKRNDGTRIDDWEKAINQSIRRFCKNKEGKK